VITKLRDVKSTFLGFSRLAELASETKECAFDTIEVDMSAADWIEANMSAPLGVVFSHLVDGLNTVQPVALQPGVESILTRNLFLVGYGYPERGENYGTAIPYRRFKREDHRYFSSYLNKHLVGKGIPEMTEGLGRRFKNSILEIFMNAATHSETDIGIFACGLFFPTKQRLDFSIADAGIGIRRKIRKVLNLRMNSDEAILWALEEGNTTRRGDVPGGLGLKLLREFVDLNGGRIQIVSDRGYCEFARGKETAKRFEHSFPGTVVNLEINTADTQSYCLSSEKITENLF
jgi:signal transduction histidine kinase